MPKMLKITWTCANCKKSGEVVTQHLTVKDDFDAKALLVTESHRLYTSYQIGKGYNKRLVEWCLVPDLTTKIEEITN